MGKSDSINTKVIKQAIFGNYQIHGKFYLPSLTTVVLPDKLNKPLDKYINSLSTPSIQYVEFLGMGLTILLEKCYSLMTQYIIKNYVAFLQL